MIPCGGIGDEPEQCLARTEAEVLALADNARGDEPLTVVFVAP
jgi:hypothetical protein